MKKSKDILIKLICIMLLSIMVIIILECNNLYILREKIVFIFPYLNGKKELISNIFLGILASAFCMYIGEMVNLKHLKKDLKNEIEQIFDEIIVKISFINGLNRQSYIRNSQLIIQYHEKIQRLYSDYVGKIGNEYYVIYYLNIILMYYKALYENEYMKNSNTNLFKEYSDMLLKLFDGDLRNLYSRSVNDEKAMELRRNFESIINRQTMYDKERDENTDIYIREIKKIEPKIKELYDIQVKNKPKQN